MTKVGIIGAGGVGAACVLATVMRGVAREIVLVNRDKKRAIGVVTDVQYGATQSPRCTLRAGDYPDLKGASLVMITIGINEKTGGATDRSDPAGRLKLLKTNAAIYRDAIAKIHAAAPQALILVVTDPPDPLTQLAGEMIGHEKVLSTGTFLDSLRFRWHLANHLGIDPISVDANVVGEHGTTEVFLWSSATVGGMPLTNLGITPDQYPKIESEVRYANINIIEGIGASQYGIGMISARIAEIILRDEQSVIPIGSYQPRFQTVLSLPSIVGRKGIVKVLNPSMTTAEDKALQRSADAIRTAFKSLN